ncbi:Asparaginyl-tRNA synthetase [Hyphodiscus hymeniophilus]|uniref:asparagine--tRNA ligase n=1 Tax=Hyphodiscus hymeniophilus TaxID=353542 RepID=A0A9P7AV63_9HELO|nr:Asparaginyl-tRNA synthetase [Hyphodiscus hymeniophilus]
MLLTRRLWRYSSVIPLHSTPRDSVRHYASTVSVSDLLDRKDGDLDNVIVNGYVRSIRSLKNISFASIGDGSTLEPLQALLTPQQSQRQNTHSLSVGTAVRLSGSWQPSPNTKAQSHELHVEGVNVVGSADPTTFPLQKKYHTPEYLRTMPHLRTRTPFNSTLLRFRSESIAQVTQYFHERRFTQTHPPIITSSDCEGAGEVFSVETAEEPPAKEGQDVTFFKSPKYLTVSSQLHLEALAQSVGNVWTLSPTFRAEKSDTARHLSEFYMLEAEISFEEDMEKVMFQVEDMLKNLVSALNRSRVGKDVLYGKRPGDEPGQAAERSKELEERWRGIIRDSSRWPTITYSTAIELLQKSPREFEHVPKWGSGLQAEHERWIASTIGEGGPVFVTHYPKKIKPFYMLPSNTLSNHGETVDCFDLLLPEICEIVGGSMREHRLERLLERMRTSGLIDPRSDDAGSLRWYIDLRRWGSVPHGGFGLGFDRLLCYLTGEQNIREVVTFPRWHGRCDC